jgi:ribosomal protein L19E
MTNAKLQKRLAASILKCGKRKVWCVDFTASGEGKAGGV